MKRPTHLAAVAVFSFQVGAPGARGVLRVSYAGGPTVVEFTDYVGTLAEAHRDLEEGLLRPLLLSWDAREPGSVQQHSLRDSGEVAGFTWVRSAPGAGAGVRDWFGEPTEDPASPADVAHLWRHVGLAAETAAAWVSAAT